METFRLIWNEMIFKVIIAEIERRWCVLDAKN